METGTMDGNFAKQQVTFLSGPWQAFEAAWIFYCHRWRVLVSIMAVPLLWQWCSMLASSYAAPQWLPFLMLLVFVINLLAMLALTYFIAQDLERPYDWRLAYRQSARLFWSYLGVNILVGLITLGAASLLLVPGLIVSIYLIFSIFILVAENKRGWSSLLASWGYVSGYWWAVFGRLLFFALLALIGNLAAHLLTAVLAWLLSFWSPTIALAVKAVIATAFSWWLVVPLSTIYFFYLYNELKHLKPQVEATTPTGHNRQVWLVIFLIFGLLMLVVLATGIGVGLWWLTKLASFPTQPVPIKLLPAGLGLLAS